MAWLGLWKSSQKERDAVGVGPVGIAILVPIMPRASLSPSQTSPST